MFARTGLTIGEMNEAQRKLAHALLQSGLSQRGYMTATGIMELEGILRDIEAAAPAPAPGGRGGRGGAGQRFDRNPDRYFFSVFGTPSAKGAWGWRVEGHHMSLHFSVSNGSMVSTTPTFFGTNPAEVREGPRNGLRLLGPQEDAARALLMALTADQRKKAVFNETAPSDIVTMNKFPIEALEGAGLPAGEMTPPQREGLMRLVDVYASYMAPDLAADRMAKIKAAGPEKITFAWAGPSERGQRHYYRVQGPTFLIEYDNTQNNGNHVHSVWRDFNGDFGRDILREHLKAAH
jgi:hypothetical protein